MSQGLSFQQLFRGVLAHHVEYSYSEQADSFTAMIPLQPNLLPRVVELATTIPFAGDWSWSVERFAGAMQPNELLFRLDWLHGNPTAITLYCRFPAEPSTAEFQKAIGFAHGFGWHGPDPSTVATALGVGGPRGIALRASSTGILRTAVYFRTDEHAGASWTNRLTALLDACNYPRSLASTIEAHLKELYRPGPIGVIGVDDGRNGVPDAIKFDPANVPLNVTFGFLARMGVPAARIHALQKVAVGMRADAVSYAGVQYRPEGFSGFRLYFACEPAHGQKPGRVTVGSQRKLRPVRRLPHH